MPNDELLLTPQEVQDNTYSNEETLEIAKKYFGDVLAFLDPKDLACRIQVAKAQLAKVKQHDEQSQDIVCPFCGEEDFDKIGLKWHLQTHCGIYQETEALL